MNKIQRSGKAMVFRMVGKDTSKDIRIIGDSAFKAVKGLCFVNSLSFLFPLRLVNNYQAELPQNTVKNS